MLPALVLVFLFSVGCASDGGSAAPPPSPRAGEGGATGAPSPAAAPCDPEVREPIDPGSYTHPLSNADPTFSTDPPTSGPHAPGPPVGGVLDEPISRPVQVGALEAGGVLLQHRDLSPDELAALVELAGEDVAVAPNPDLPARVVATAWLTKQTCTAVDPAALQTFVTAHRGQGPGNDG